jgi:hypothetical protein
LAWPNGTVAQPAQGSPTAPVQCSQRREHEDGEGKSLGKKDGSVAHQGGRALTSWWMGRCDGAPVSFGDGGGVLQHGGVEGGEGGRLNEEEEGRRVGLLEEGGAAGALQPNSSEGRGSRCSSTPWMGSWC